jgi:hypothetical protein
VCFCSGPEDCCSCGWRSDCNSVDDDDNDEDDGGAMPKG